MRKSCRRRVIHLLPLLILLLGLGCRRPAEGDPGSDPWPPMRVQRQSSPPVVELSNGRFRVVVLLPGAGSIYDEVRFDHSALVGLVELDGHTFIGRRTHGADGTEAVTYALGPSQEYRTMQERPDRRRYRSGGLPAGQGQVRIGSWRLDADGQKVERLPWTVDVEPRAVRFEQTYRGDDGWGYRLIKRVVVAADRPSFTIEHAFENIGRHPVRRLVYAHNWMAIDGDGGGPHTAVEFAGPVVLLRPKDGVRVEGQALRFDAPLDGEEAHPVFVELQGPVPAAQNRVTVRRLDSGAGFHIEGDWDAAFINVYATGEEICPEPHLDLDVPPGQTVRWSDTYTFFTGR